jgi:hypothetical protein
LIVYAESSAVPGGLLGMAALDARVRRNAVRLGGAVRPE